MKKIKENWIVFVIFTIILIAWFTPVKADKLSAYPFKTSLGNSDFFPIVASGANANVNWQYLQALTTSAINWTALPLSVQSGNINWASVNALGPINNGGMNWSDINRIAKINSGGINWSNTNILGTINNGGINWQNNVVTGQTITGVNWNAFTNSTGINWAVMSNNATAATLMCWKSNGQPGKCATSVSGVLCTACN